MIIDFNAHIGTWPEKNMRCSVVRLKKILVSSKIDCAVFSDITPVFSNKNELTPGLKKERVPDMFIPFLSLGPHFSVGQIKKKKEKIKGVRLYPVYTKYPLRQKEWYNLFTYAEQQNWIIQIYLRLVDIRTIKLTKSIASVIGSVEKIVEKYQGLKFVISGVTLEDIKKRPELFRQNNVWVEISHLQHPINALYRLLGLVDSTKVLFGSNAPLFYPKSATFQIENSEISREDKKRILAENAQKMLEDNR